jgi:hypothetical protein
VKIVKVILSTTFIDGIIYDKSSSKHFGVLSGTIIAFKKQVILF